MYTKIYSYIFLWLGQFGLAGRMRNACYSFHYVYDVHVVAMFVCVCV